MAVHAVHCQSPDTLLLNCRPNAVFLPSFPHFSGFSVFCPDLFAHFKITLFTTLVDANMMDTCEIPINGFDCEKFNSNLAGSRADRCPNGRSVNPAFTLSGQGARATSRTKRKTPPPDRRGVFV